MPSLLPKSPLSPQCIACCRNLSMLGLSISPAAGQVGQMQIRGKKKNPKARTQVNVKLIKDLPGYGRKGAIVPVPIGRMRNYYFPLHIADYVSMAEARDLKRTNVTIERDYEFGKETSDEGAEIKEMGISQIAQPARGTRSSDPVRIDLEVLEPAAAFIALSDTIPSFVNFYRTPIVASETTKPSSSTEPAASSNNIYGSVSTADVATNLKALLASTVVAGKIVLAEDDITFTSIGDAQSDRVKQLGTFNIEIKVKGYNEAIRRQVRVLPEDEAPADEATRDEKASILAGENPISGEPSEALLSMEAQVAELEAALSDAKTDRNIGGPGAFGQPQGSESAPGAAHEKSA